MNHVTQEVSCDRGHVTESDHVTDFFKHEKLEQSGLSMQARRILCNQLLAQENLTILAPSIFNVIDLNLKLLKLRKRDC